MLPRTQDARPTRRRYLHACVIVLPAVDRLQTEGTEAQHGGGSDDCVVGGGARGSGDAHEDPRKDTHKEWWRNIDDGVEQGGLSKIFGYS